MASYKETAKGIRSRVRPVINLPLILVATLIFGCAPVGPNYKKPDMDLPSQWKNSQHEDQRNDQSLLEWWHVFNDPMLEDLIGQAIANNLDLKIAISRVREARFQLKNAKTSLLPSINASGSGRRSGSKSEIDVTPLPEYYAAGSDAGLDNDVTSISELYAAGLDASWELDIFGGTRRSVEASTADLQAQVEDLNDVVVSLLAEVALNYVQLREYQQRLKSAEANVAYQRETWELLDALSKAGRGDELAVAQARYNLESSRANLPAFETSIEAAMNRLALLVGKPAGYLHPVLEPVAKLPQASIMLAVGVPADILRQRPDIRQAERALAAQTARIGVAESALYPQFKLSGSIGIEAPSFGKLLRNPASAWSFGPSVSLPVFNGGSLRNNIKIQEELRTQTFLTYENTVLSAVEEVENAIIAYVKEQQKLRSLHQAVAAARLAAEFAELQYSAGITGFTDVLDAQRSLNSLEDQENESAGVVLTNLIALYKALGGGWQTYDLASAQTQE